LEEERTMRRLAVVLVLVIAGALPVGSTDATNPPSRFTFTVDDTFPASGLSSACGFEVLVHLEGTSTATLFFDKNGTIIREIDANANFMITFSAPSTGKSFSYPLGGPFIQEYINGTAIGSHALATANGFQAGTGSTAPDAGKVVFDVVIVDTSPEGIPIVDIVDVISASGHFNDNVTAARCATLSASSS
jgi:hypothetical protein